MSPIQGHSTTNWMSTGIFSSVSVVCSSGEVSDFDSDVCTGLRTLKAYYEIIELQDVSEMIVSLVESGHLNAVSSLPRQEVLTAMM